MVQSVGGGRKISRTTVAACQNPASISRLAELSRTGTSPRRVPHVQALHGIPNGDIVVGGKSCDRHTVASGVKVGDNTAHRTRRLATRRHAEVVYLCLEVVTRSAQLDQRHDFGPEVGKHVEIPKRAENVGKV